MRQTDAHSDSGWRPHSRRSELIPLVLEFVRRVSDLSGIREIALIGSLTTTKQDPKDADLLVTVDDNLDLAQLARLGRRLQGQAQSIGHGADIFLLSPAGDYIGRICHWKECRPGIRISCDALNCGAREFLHDDLRTVHLKRNVIDDPPLKLWPAVYVRGHVPPDILAGLVTPLENDRTIGKVAAQSNE